MKSRIQQITDFRKKIPDVYHRAWRKQYDKAVERKSMKAAVAQKCLECMVYQMPEVSQCDIFSCPLHAYRPGEKSGVEASVTPVSCS